MSVAGRWFITPHAVQRYRERVDRGVSYEVALERLVELSLAAHRVREREDGTEEWRVGRTFGKLRFRVHPSTTPDSLPQLLTVLAAFDGTRPR